MKLYFNILLTLCLVSLLGCKAKVVSADEPSVWDDSTMWYQTNDTISDEKIDLFYLVSTEVLTSTDSLGNVSYQAFLTEEDRKAIAGEFAFVEKHYSQGDYNFIAPYYHQFNFSAITLPEDQFAEVYASVADEVCEAFDYYMRHINHGRRYALVGFSQGGMLILDLLKHMNQEQYNQMIGAYMLGYRLSKEDLECPFIIAATDETTPGVTVSFNSVQKLEAAWPVVCKDAAAAINPVNWETDCTPAILDFIGDSLTVTMDEASHLLVVNVPDPESYHEWMQGNPAYAMAKVDEDCLHRWDLLFYADKIHENINIRNK